MSSGSAAERVASGALYHIAQSPGKHGPTSASSNSAELLIFNQSRTSLFLPYKVFCHCSSTVQIFSVSILYLLFPLITLFFF